MKTLHVGLVGHALALLPHDDLNFSLGFLHHLFNARGVDAPILQQLDQRDPRHLAAHGVVARKSNRFGGVIHNNVNPSELLEGPDVAALAPDDPPLEFFARQVHGRDRNFGDIVTGGPLNGEPDDFPGGLIGLFVGLLFDLADAPGGIITSLAFDLRQDDRPGLVAAQLRNALQLGHLGNFEALSLLM